MVKQLHTNSNLLIVIDLWILHYKILLITHLKFLKVKNVYHVKKEKNSIHNVAGVKHDKLIYKCRECKKECISSITTELKEKFPGIYQFCNGGLDKFVLLLRKCVYPYEYMDSCENLDENTLPPKTYFYSNFSLGDISDNDYEHAQNVWDVFTIKNLGKYHDLYVQTDTLLLSDVYKNFRNMCLNICKLDPTYFVYAPGLA